MNPSIFSHNLRYYRLTRGYTQMEMSQRLHIQRQTYCNYENGHREPSLTIMAEIAAVLNVDLHVLITGQPGPVILSEEEYKTLLTKNTPT